MNNPYEIVIPSPKTDTGPWVVRRGDAIGTEQDAAWPTRKRPKPMRPWMVVSQENVHRRKCFVGCVMTTADGIRDKTWLVDNNSGYINPQQIWTHPAEKISAHREPIAIAGDAAQALRNRLMEVLEFTDQNTGTEIRQGQVVGLRLMYGHRGTTIQRGWLSRQAALTDVGLLNRLLQRLNLPPVVTPEDAQIPAVVVTSDRFLPPNLVPSRNGPHPVAAVVPLIALRDHEHTNVSRVVMSGGARTAWVPVPMQVMTVDYRAIGRNQLSRIVPNYGGDEVLRLDEASVRRILDELRRNVGIRPGVAS